jgi:hypothetical protein
MAYDRKQLEEDILENLNKYSDRGIKAVFGEKNTVITIEDTGMTAYLSNTDKASLWDEEITDRMISNMDKIHKEIERFYEYNVGRGANMKCVPLDSENMSLKINIDGERELSYDLFEENLTVLNERQKMGIMRDELNAAKKEKSFERTVRRITRNAEEKGMNEEDIKEQIYELMKKFEIVDKAKTEIKSDEEVDWDKVGDMHDVENPSDISEVPVKTEVKEAYTKIIQKFSDNSMKKELKDIMVKNDNFSKESSLTATKLYDKLEEDLEPLSGTYIGTITITEDIDRFTLQNITDNGMKLGIATLSEDLSKSFSNDMREYLALIQKNDKTNADIDMLDSNKISRMITRNPLEEGKTSIFQAYAEDFLKNNLSIEKIENGEIAKYTGGRDDRAVAIVPLKDNTDFEMTFNLLNDTMKKLPDDVTEKTVRAVMDNNTAYEYTSRTSRNAKEGVYTNTDSITAIEDESFATMYVTRNGNPTRTFNTNDNEFMKVTVKPLTKLRDEFEKDIRENSGKIIPDDIIIIQDRQNNATVIHDVPNEAIHCINNETLDKLSVKYDGSRKNQVAQKYLDTILEGNIRGLDDAINIALACDGKTSVVLKPSNTENLEKNPVMEKVMKNDIYKSLITGSNTTTINIVLNEKNGQDMVRINDGDIVQHTNPEALSDVKYADNIGKLEKMIDKITESTKEYIEKQKNVENIEK